MSRTPNVTTLAPTVQANTKAISSALASADVLSAADMVAADQSDLYRIVGRLEAFQFLETVSSRMLAEGYLAAKAVIGKLGSITVKNRHTRKVETVSGIDEFCEAAMPVTGRRCRQLIATLHTLGPELYEQAEQLGLGQRNYNAIRALPNDMQDQVKAAIASGDKGEVVTLIEELAARNASANAELTELRKTTAAKDRVIAKKDSKLNELAEREEMRRNGAPDEREKQQINDLRDVGLEAEQTLQRLVALVDEVTQAPATEAAELQARQTLDYIAQRLADICAERGISVDVLGERVEPGWQRAITGVITEAAAQGQDSQRTKRRA